MNGFHHNSSPFCSDLTHWPLGDFNLISTLVQVMAWCRQATSHYLSQCWPRSMLPNGVTRPQWVNQWIQRYHEHIAHKCWRIFLYDLSYGINSLISGDGDGFVKLSPLVQVLAWCLMVLLNPLYEAMLAYHQWFSLAFTCGQIWIEMLQIHRINH